MAKARRRLQGRVALITGASRGLGRALALAFASEGTDLVLNSRAASATELEQVRAEAERQGIRAVALDADLASRAGVERLAAVALGGFARVDILVNNASALGPTPLPLLADTPLEAFREVLETNVIGPYLLTRSLIGQMLVRGSGLVINVSSDAATAAYPGWGAYGVSKAGLDQLTRIWAAELEGTGIGIISVDPGSMNTLMHRQAEPDEDPAQWAAPEVVAPILAALATADPTEINGQRFEAQEQGLLPRLQALNPALAGGTS
jgi:NAD(P)-dependent dehydrogenase (short-subunit alcohol dehydrogenase family)